MDIKKPPKWEALLLNRFDYLADESTAAESAANESVATESNVVESDAVSDLEPPQATNPNPNAMNATNNKFFILFVFIVYLFLVYNNAFSF